jgi:Na+/H+ antiporter NhaD/arsenite permease-like protein
MFSLYRLLVVEQLLIEFSFGLSLFCVSLLIGLFCIPAVLGKEGILLEWVGSWVIRISNQNGAGILCCFFLLVID